MKPGEVTLIGAGLVGSLLGIFLARRGFSVTIFERRPDMRRQSITAGRSINLALANRGMVALERIGILQNLKPLLIPMAGRMLHDEAGTTQFSAYGHRPEEVIYSVSRGGLNQRLLNLAEAEGVKIVFQRNCLGVDFEKKQVHLRDEATQELLNEPFDVLLGTDGSASHVRDAILKATGGTCTEEPLGHGYKELCIPADANGNFQMDASSLHIWPRGEFMLIALPNPGGSFTLTLFLPNTGAESFASLTTPDKVNAFFTRYFVDAKNLLPDLTDQFFHNPLGTLSTVRCDTWHNQNQALLLGDAAHAIVPFHGQGMNCGFEDVVALDQCLSEKADWQSTFQKFFQLRKPNADAIADMAIENYLEMRATVRDPKFALKKALSFALEDRFSPHFIPRYSMVMFHTIPYAEAQRRGKIQETILEELTRGKSSVEEVDMKHAHYLIQQKL